MINLISDTSPKDYGLTEDSALRIRHELISKMRKRATRADKRTRADTVNK